MNQQVELKSRHTRFRAYQLKSHGASFSYWDGNTFTLGEARFNEDNKASIYHELNQTTGARNIDRLHITSWDQDHCDFSELKEILIHFKPAKIETPGYSPNTLNGNECEKLIDAYVCKNNAGYLNFSKEGLSHLQLASKWEYIDIGWIKNKFCSANNNSSIKLFRSGCFNVLSLGDVESKEIAESLLTSEIMRNEVDILILPHHGADNGFISSKFLQDINPKFALALCDWDNRYRLSNKSILNRLDYNDIDYLSTKQGDIIIESVTPHTEYYQVWDYISDGHRLNSSSCLTASKRYNSWKKQKALLINN